MQRNIIIAITIAIQQPTGNPSSDDEEDEELDVEGLDDVEEDVLVDDDE